MKQELQDKLDRAVQMRDEAFHECLNAIHEVLKANDHFLDLHKDRRPSLRALVWDKEENNYVPADIHAARLGNDALGFNVVEFFAKPNTPYFFNRKEMEAPENDYCWHPISVDSESIYPMDPVFELAWQIDDFVEEEPSQKFHAAAYEIVYDLLDANVFGNEIEALKWEEDIAKMLEKSLGAKTADRKPISRVYVLRNELIPESFAEDTEEEIKKFLDLQEAYFEDKEEMQDKFTGVYTLEEFERLVNECGDDSLCPDVYSIRVFTDGEPSPSRNELADARKDYVDRLVKVIEPFAPCKVEVEHEDGVLSDNKATYSIKKDENGNLLFTDIETEITFTAEDAVDGELYAIAKKLTQKN